MILLKEGKTFAGGDDDFPVRRLQLSGQDLQKGGFTCTVGADQAIAVPFCEFDIDILK